MRSPLEQVIERLTEQEILSRFPGLKKNGSEYEGNCPSGHDSKSGKCFKLNTDKKMFHCFNCGESGNYIHLIELKKFGSTSRGKKSSENFIEVLRELARELGINMGSTGKTRDCARVFEAIDFIAHYYHNILLRHPDVIKSASDRYGLSEEFIKNEVWGFAGKCPSEDMIGVFSKEEILSTGLFYESKNTKSGMFHIMHNRLTMPYIIKGAIQYIIGKRTSVTNNFNGNKAPKYLKQMIKSDKRPYISEEIINPVVRNDLNSEDILITEGITDYLAAKQSGINALSAVTVRFKNTDARQVAELCKNKNVFIANDNELSGCGNRGAETMVEELLLQGIHPTVIELPIPKGETKVDFNEYMKSHDLNSFLELKKKSAPYLQKIVEETDPKSDKRRISTALKIVSDGAMKLSSLEKEVFIKDVVVPHFGLCDYQEVVKELYKQFKVGKKEEEDSKKSSLFDTEGDGKFKISSGHDFKKGHLYRTVTREALIETKKKEIKTVYVPYLVRSDGKVFEIKDQFLVEDIAYMETPMTEATEFSSWSITEGEFSVAKFVGNEVHITPQDVFNEVKSIFKNHVYFKYEFHYDLLTIACMTYPMYMIFQTTGYIQLWAQMGSGKSTVLEVIERLCLNANSSTSISDAAMYRMIGKSRPLWLIDEAENLNPSPRARENAPNEKLEIMKSGYKRGRQVYRCDMNSNDVVKFDNYAPRIMAGTKNLDATLADRAIRVDIEKMPYTHKVQDFSKAETRDRLDRAKDMITCFTMMYAEKINEIYQKDPDINADNNFLADKGIRGRDWEIAVPFLTVARLVDEHSKNRVLDSIIDSILISKKTKEMFSPNTFYIEIVEILYLFLKKIRETESHLGSKCFDGEWYSKSVIRNRFIRGILQDQNEYGEKYKHITMDRLRTDCLKRLLIIDVDDEKRMRIGGERVSCIHLNSDRILSALNGKMGLEEETMKDIDKWLKRIGLPDRKEKERMNIEELGIGLE